MPNKVCPKCSESLHVRCSNCKCGHVFYEKKTPSVNVGVKNGGPKKECPKCKLMLHVKRSSCNCGHVFYKTDKGPEPEPLSDEVKKEMIHIASTFITDQEMPEKACPECNDVVPSKTSICKCGHVFYHTKQEEKSWQKLSPGDLIRSVHGYGPYWVDTKHNDEPTYMGVYGLYKVKSVDLNSNGLWVTQHGVGKLSGKHYDEFMYMGPPKRSKLMETLINEPHKILVFKPKRN